MKEKLVKKTVYLLPKLAKKLEKIAKSERNSITRVIEMIIAEHFERESNNAKVL